MFIRYEWMYISHESGLEQHLKFVHRTPSGHLLISTKAED
jgi:hypothetical protein